MVSFVQVSLLISFACLMSLGQLLFKKTSLSISNQNIEATSLIEGIIRSVQIPWLYMALTVYAFATILWLYILQRIPLSIAYPFSALAMVIVPILAVFIFGERLSWSYWLGALFIFIGIIIIAR